MITAAMYTAHEPLASPLKFLLACLYRELAAAAPSRAGMKVLAERTAELEWLFHLTSQLRAAADDREVVKELLRGSTERLQCAAALLVLPERRMEIESHRDESQGDALRRVVAGMRKHLLTWVQRQRQPLVMNGNAGPEPLAARCKILAVPIVREGGGRVVGLLAFFNPCDAADFNDRQVFLARHLGREAAALVAAQFDSMTGLYTRDGLERMYSRDNVENDRGEGSVVYFDIDRMQVVNGVHGFELGNELIIRVAELVGSASDAAVGGISGALAARISGDRFAVVLPESDTRVAVELATRLQGAAARLVIGPAREPMDVSVSCGVAALVPMPQGLARALAAAELACKKAKERGRNRVERYAFEDNSMMRCHEDAMAVGQLRAALKADRLLLYAQRIVPLQNPELPGGYELLMRMRDAREGIVAPGPLIAAAQRYQLLPSVDRWAVRRALDMLSPFRDMLASRGLFMSVNVSGQSIGDAEFVQLFTDQLRAAQLPSGSITVEITEQAAATDLVRAADMTERLGQLGCQIALDDFGTGANSLANLKRLRIGRVKIDGSFVRDILTDRRSQATVRAIVELAKGYRIDTVAEYVETREIAEMVRGLGVDYAQGYAFGHPEPLDELLMHLAHDESRRLHRMYMEM